MRSTRLQNVRAWVGDGDWRSDLTIEAGTIASGIGEVELDLGGRVATPGLIDAHVHLVMGALSRHGVDVSDARGMGALVKTLMEASVDLGEDDWLVAQGWDDTRWPPDARLTHDQLAPLGDRPVVCWRCDLHAALVNSAVLERLDLPASSKGAHTGLLVEEEAWNHLIPAMPEPSARTAQAALLQAAPWLHAQGITGLRSMEYRDQLETVIDPVADQLDLRLAITLLDRSLPLDLDWLAHRSTTLPRVIGCKAFFDGTLGSRTARMAEPFLDRGDCGRWVELALADQDKAWCHSVVAAGLSPAIHAIGDAAVARAASVLSEVPDALRPTIEHAQILPEGMMEMLASLRLSVQPVHRAEDARAADVFLGSDRASRMLPLATLHDAGARLAFGTDWPVTAVDPMRTLRAAITGATVEGVPFRAYEAIDNTTALHAMTLGAAEAIGLPGASGLRDGAAADLVVWDGDPLTWSGDDDPPRAALVFVDGRLVHGDPAALA